MKHLAQIQLEFLKQARQWDDLTLKEQKEYLQRHPKSKRRITAKPTLKDNVKYVGRKILLAKGNATDSAGITRNVLLTVNKKDDLPDLFIYYKGKKVGREDKQLWDDDTFLENVKKLLEKRTGWKGGKLSRAELGMQQYGRVAIEMPDSFGRFLKKNYGWKQIED